MLHLNEGEHGRSIPELLRTPGLLFFVVIVLVYGMIAIHEHSSQDRARASPSTRGRDPRRRLDQPVLAACAVAVPLDLGDDALSRIEAGVSLTSRASRPSPKSGG